MGGYLNGLIILMFLLSVGYSNNLLLIFTLFLFGFNILWVIQTHFHQLKVNLRNVTVSDGHALQSVPVEIHWNALPPGPPKWDFTLVTAAGEYPVRHFEDSLSRSLGEIQLSQRGVHRWKYLKVSSDRPFGLYYTWRYIPLEVKSIAYPEVAKELITPLLHVSAEQGEFAQKNKGQGDWFGFAPYSGEEARRISWKHYARTGEVVVKEGEDQRASEVKFDLPGPSQDKEQILSHMATQMLHCHAQEITFTLRTPKGALGPAFHTAHLRQCLRELGLC